MNSLCQKRPSMCQKGPSMFQKRPSMCCTSPGRGCCWILIFTCLCVRHVARIATHWDCLGVRRYTYSDALGLFGRLSMEIMRDFFLVFFQLV